jgi:hypothetical protein
MARSTASETAADESARLDQLVDEASLDSFPASDPPSFWARPSSDVDTKLTEPNE